MKPGFELDRGRLRVVRCLGSGASGFVYEAEHTTAGKRVAVKCLHPSPRPPSTETIQCALREAHANANVQHPNAVDVYDVGCDGHIVFLVMELLEGEPLAQWLARPGFPLHHAVAMLIPAMRAVAFAHHQGVVHRDITPHNIYLARELDVASPVPKVLDFGASKLAAAISGKVPQPSSRAARYMSRERFAGREPIDERADVYAFGAILYEALTSHRPRAQRARALAAREMCPEVPPALDRLVRWALASDRAKRLPSLDVFLAELQPFSRSHGFHE